MMNKKVINIILILAGLLLLVGIIIAFINLNKLKLESNNSGYVSAIFALSGVLFYFAALMYQIKEYKLQVEELKKSVEAQTKSSEALDEQKRILLEQNSNSLIFGMINSFHLFNERNKMHFIINSLFDYYPKVFALRLQSIVQQRLSHEELNMKFAQGIQELFSKTIVAREEYTEFKRYIQFVYNILYLIDQNKSNMTKDNFTPFFFSQLNTKETVFIYLANLVDSGLPFYNNLHWSYYTTSDIINMIKNNKKVYTDFDQLDLNILTTEFQKLKHNN